MRMYNTLHKCEVETIGVITPSAQILCVTDAGQWLHCNQDQLVPLTKGKPDMHITVGHVIDNPTFMFLGEFEITTADANGDVHVHYDSQRDFGEDVPVYLLTENVTYMAVNESTEPPRLRIEVM